MSGRIVSKTSEELRALTAAGRTGSDWERARSHAPDLTDPDAPDASGAMRRELTRLRGRPKGSGSKEATSIRIDRDVLAAFRATGRGWQTRMNDALRQWLASPRARPRAHVRPRRAAKQV